MSKRGFLVVAGLLGLCGCLSAQQVQDGSVLAALRGSPTRSLLLSLSDARSFPFSNAFAWNEATPGNFLPDWRPTGWDNPSSLNLATTSASRRSSTVGSSISSAKDTSKEVVDLRRTNLFDNVHGEVGVFYGRSSGGRNSMDTEGGYIFGETGNDKVQIGVGAYYENSNYQFPRRGR